MVPESLGWTKKCKHKYDHITWLYILINTLNQKISEGKKFIYVLAKDIDAKRKFEIKAKQISAWKRPIFLGHPNSGSCVQNA